MLTHPNSGIDDEAPSFQKLSEAYRAGDLWRFADALVDSGGDVHPGNSLHRLRALVRERAEQDREAFADEVLQHGLELVAYVAIRTQILMERAILEQNRSLRCGQLHSLLPETVTAKLLPQLVQMQRHLGEMLEMRAATLRKRELAVAKRRENRQPAPEEPPESEAHNAAQAEEHQPGACRRSAAQHVSLNGSMS